MRLLILGGTEFVGRAVTEAAVARSCEVTVFNRGSRPVPAGVRVLRGDRTAPDGLAALADGEWDLVVDTWSADPGPVRDAARLLAERAGRYAYVSSRSVYTWPAPAGAAEDAPVVAGAGPDETGVPYPEAKRGGELAALDAFGPDRTLLARAGLILGPWENIGRLPWWLRRIARGGPVLAPGPRELPLQYIDARDLAGWLLTAAGAGLSGAYDLVSPPGHTTMGELLDTCVRVTGADAELRWTEPEKILAAGITPWTELPVWSPPGWENGAYEAMHRSDPGKARAAGLRCRPVAETVADTWAWLRAADGTDRTGPEPARRAMGLPAEKEAEVLNGG
ncbi:reductase [Streptomyces sp. LP05-1]|uniref:Reductase n=1 Tax=Streptomyces pyxinae TaxID=2970734 RepID=A0ABT2CFT3_9ACTN|nr:NAD-dependent epimerase/dehydratase family protein [Streptomyces sp. LP05-1]MCS0636273.1 reductase [Streptomyces sp. LP05-1]